MNVTTLKTKAESQLREQFDAAAEKLPGTGWVSALRARAMDAFAAEGLPHRRVEEWKYTDLRERLRDVPAPGAATAKTVTSTDLDRALGPFAAIDAERIVLVDGVYSADLSKVSAEATVIELMSLAAMLEKAPAWLEGKFSSNGGAVVALNTAFMSDGVLLKVRKDQDPGKPVLLVHARTATEPTALAVRNVISVEAGAKLTLVEAHVTLDGAARGALSNIVTDVTIGDGATCDHIKSLADATASTHLATWTTKLGKDATYRGFQLTASPALARNDINILFNGEGGKLDLSGAFLARGAEHIDTTLVVDHAVPHCESRELFKGVLDGRAHGIFQGKIIVRPDAQKTDGKQMSQALMLSPDAQFSSKPELEIYADDVVCGHGATCTEIDADLLFYCRSRGIPPDVARAMLTESFIGEAVEKIENEAVREAIGTLAIDWLRTK
ncbi:Fe-S cluster assembly protein SufD [Hyphomicrobium sp. CS1BSMeth3]|uniref:Fe-S cluster assembly protein SufD n=1 Tax=Hyphomicrobium sp. CS1BSMeth3 TaxID=1892844 RepID=UPI000931A25F|nr:Fe-S cluster assembly protein SufD [Hyphomicrobium sp. CS1BSMeth3]